MKLDFFSIRSGSHGSLPVRKGTLMKRSKQLREYLIFYSRVRSKTRPHVFLRREVKEMHKKIHKCFCANSGY